MGVGLIGGLEVEDQISARPRQDHTLLPAIDRTNGDADSGDPHQIPHVERGHARVLQDPLVDEPGAVDAVFSAVRAANTALDEGDDTTAASLATTVMALMSVLGVEIGVENTDGLDEAQALARERDDARSAKDFARADAIRDQLTAMGFQVMDTPEGTVVHR